MAGMILGAAGAVIGGIFGGPIGAQIGYMIGSIIGNMIDPPKGTTSEGSRLTDLSSATAAYGTYYGIVYGLYKRSGNIFWSSEKIEHKNKSTSGGGKGAGATNTTISYTYTISFAQVLNDGPISALYRIFQTTDSVIYSANVESSIESKISSSDLEGYFTVYFGTEDQLPDPTIESYEGVGNVPGYRGMAYIVWKDLNLGTSGTIPSLSYEVAGVGAAETGGTYSIIENIHQATGYVTNNIQNGEAYRNNFFVNPRSFTHNSVTFKNSLNIFSIKDFKAVLNPGLLYLDDSRSYTNKDLDDHNFIFNFKTGYIESFDYIIPEFAIDNGNIAPTIHLSSQYITNLQKEGERMYIPIGNMQMNYWLYINTKNILNPISRNENVSNAEPVFLLSKVLAVAPSDTTYMVNLDKSLPSIAEGKYFKGACVSSDGLYGYVFYGDADFKTSSKVYYSKFLRDDYDITITENGEINENIKLVGTSNSGIVFQGFGGVYCSVDNNFLYLTDTISNTKIYKNKNLSFNYDTTLTDANMHYQSQDLMMQAQSGILYELNEKNSGMFSTARTITKNSVKMSEVLADLYERAGIPSSSYDITDIEDIEVRGYFVNNQKSMRTIVEELQSVFFFDTFKSGGVLKSVKRGKDVIATITPDDLIIEDNDSGEPISDFDFTFIQEASLPQQVSVSYADYEQDYLASVQYARRLSTNSTQKSEVTIPALLTSDEAVEIAHKYLYTAWTERLQVSFNLSLDFIQLEPCDIIQVIDIRDNAYIMRITEIDQGTNGVIKITAVQDERVALQQSIKGAYSDKRKPQINAKYYEETEGLMMNLPLLISSQPDSNNYYVGVGHEGESKWEGGIVYTSKDNQTYSTSSSLVFEREDGLAFGNCITTLQGSDCFSLDTTSYVDIILQSKSEELDSFEKDYLYRNNINYALIGDEVVQFSNADLIDENKYRLSGFIRGIGGTELNAKNHSAGERFILLDLSKINAISDDLSNIGSTMYYYTQSNGKSSAGFTKTFEDKGLSIKPLAPYVFVVKNNNDYNYHWYRRARKDAGWNNNIDVPLDESTEQYSVCIFSDNTYSTIVREEILTNTTNYSYTEAKQISDFGAIKSTVYMKVYQVSNRFGKGWGGIPS